MEKFTDEKKNGVTRLFNFTIYVLDYIYKEMASIPKDFLTEIHLRFFRHNKKPNKKILGYWDFNQRLSRVGDFLEFLENLSVLRHEFNLNLKNRKNIDICFIEDPTHYNANQLRFSKTYLFKRTVKISTVVSPYVDSVMMFKSNAEFERFYQQNRRRYIRWPPTVASSVAHDNRRIERFYKKNKFIPSFNLPSGLISEIYDFYESHVYPALPIVIQLRNNLNREKFRNFDLEDFKKFFKHFEKNKSYKFIIVCNKSEIPDELRGFSNVLFSKDHFDGIEYDYAFIKTSYLGIFPNSGMVLVAYFGKVPLISYARVNNRLQKHAIPLDKKEYNFLSKYQRAYPKKEKCSLLIPEVENLIKDLKEDNINNNLKNKVKDIKKYESHF